MVTVYSVERCCKELHNMHKKKFQRVRTHCLCGRDVENSWTKLERWALVLPSSLIWYFGSKAVICGKCTGGCGVERWDFPHPLWTTHERGFSAAMPFLEHPSLRLLGNLRYSCEDSTVQALVLRRCFRGCLLRQGRHSQ